MRFNYGPLLIYAPGYPVAKFLPICPLLVARKITTKQAFASSCFNQAALSFGGQRKGHDQIHVFIRHAFPCGYACIGKFLEEPCGGEPELDICQMKP
jgi:hypothetical protein